MNYFLIVLLMLFAAINAADAWYTWQILKMGGRERWPTTVWCIDRFGVLPGLLTVKGGIVLAWGLGIWFTWSAGVLALTMWIALTAYFAGLLTTVVAENRLVYLRMIRKT